jgi:hypothetical protein
MRVLASTPAGTRRLCQRRHAYGITFQIHQAPSLRLPCHHGREAGSSELQCAYTYAAGAPRGGRRRDRGRQRDRRASSVIQYWSTVAGLQSRRPPSLHASRFSQRRAVWADMLWYPVPLKHWVAQLRPDEQPMNGFSKAKGPYAYSGGRSRYRGVCGRHSCSKARGCQRDV